MKNVLDAIEGEFMKVMDALAKATAAYHSAKEDAWFAAAAATSATARQNETDNSTRKLKGTVLALETDRDKLLERMRNIRHQMNYADNIAGVVRGEMRLAGRID